MMGRKGLILLLAALLFVVLPVGAMAQDPGCGCSTVLEGSEKYAEILRTVISVPFILKAFELTMQGYRIDVNPSAIQVERNNTTGEVLVAFPMKNRMNQQVYLLVFERTNFVVTPPMP